MIEPRGPGIKQLCGSTTNLFELSSGISLPLVTITKLPEFVVWKDGVDSSMQAVCGAYVMCMIEYFESSAIIIPTFADVGVPVDAQGNVDYESE
eukprot:3762872-Rhodomonas_salina.1